ncbi:hypothetical protein QBC43DRAFT_132027 [Cladorrhinum sp. PSN259]|nr:hypothetical protein QBC43DRAFT_132027 [Cladorrhinum sp. PSN259]
MADNNDNPSLRKESDNLIPLPAAHRQGLTGVAVLASLSFASSTVVLLYLTVKLIRWHAKTWKENRRIAREQAGGPVVDLSLGLEERHIMGPQHDATKPSPAAPARKRYPNQFLVLIYNLLLADIHQAGAFLLNAVWVARDGIRVRTPTCWIQGWLVSTGDLSSSCFITAIAVHTYLAVVRNYTPPQRAVYGAVVGLWFFNYFMALLGIGISQNGKEGGGFYVRAAAWCWINIEYETYRLTLHYLWIFISLAITSILYGLIFFHLRKHSQPSTSATPEHTCGHHRAFLLYPVIYVVCTAPLAFGRIATMVGADVPISYFCAAGALITSNGWLDVLLWGVTRHRLLFSSEVDSEESGLGTFTFMRTPYGRSYGNMIWVEGAGTEREGDWSEGTEVGWGKKRMGGWRRLGLGTRSGKPGSQETLREVASVQGENERGGPCMGIQMNMVTTVVVEEFGKGRRSMRTGRRASLGTGGGDSPITPVVAKHKDDDG